MIFAKGKLSSRMGASAPRLGDHIELVKARHPLLDKKSRTYLTLLTIAPKTVRRVHGWTMKLRGVG